VAVSFPNCGRLEKEMRKSNFKCEFCGTSLATPDIVSGRLFSFIVFPRISVLLKSFLANVSVITACIGSFSTILLFPLIKSKSNTEKVEGSAA
jgi:hypothetical protein